MRTPAFALKASEIREGIERLCYSDHVETAADRLARNHYLSRGRFVWITRNGVDGRADSLLSTLKTVNRIGFSERAFYVADIEDDLSRVRTLSFDSGNKVNDVFARLEYKLTKAYLRYAVGQRYGFVNPYEVFNRLDPVDDDSTSKVRYYKRLYDLDSQRPDREFVAKAMLAVETYRVGDFLRSVQPADTLYTLYQNELDRATTEDARRRALCNMERRRWRLADGRHTSGKYVVVNIPAFHLYAYGPDTVVDMRVGCGAVKTKTPLLTSRIERMDVNPVWNIPASIVKKEIAHKAGDTAYFSSRKYYVVERATGERVDISTVTRQMLSGGSYRVSQEGGAGNSLGRIIFRFPNKFSVFLHDTSSRGVFGRDNRGVSHGCVRIQRPFDFAQFLLDNPGEWQLDKLRLAMELPPQTDKGKRYLKEHDDNTGLVRSMRVNPAIPIYIVYYTLYPSGGEMRAYPDVYGYDKEMMKHIKLFAG